MTVTAHPRPESAPFFGERRAGGSAAGRAESTLVVEPDSALRGALVSRLLRRPGATFQAGTLAEAIEVIEARHVDVVVSHESMSPTMLAHLLAYARGRGLTLRFVTAIGGLTGRRPGRDRLGPGPSSTASVGC